MNRIYVAVQMTNDPGHANYLRMSFNKNGRWIPPKGPEQDDGFTETPGQTLAWARNEVKCKFILELIYDS